MRSVSRLLTELLVATICVGAVHSGAQDASSLRSSWKTQVDKALPLFGHRNWILIVDSAYPLQSSLGVETVETNSNQAEVLAYTLSAIDQSIHVRPIVYMDSELAFVSEHDAPGITAYRVRLQEILGKHPVHSETHEKLLLKIGDAAKTFNVLILKTHLTVPYTSVFLQLNCKYWSDDAELRLRKAMKQAPRELK